MEVLCWILMLGAAPPVTAAEPAPTAIWQIEMPLESPLPEATTIRPTADRWLSPREQWCRLQGNRKDETLNSVAFLDTMSVFRMGLGRMETMRQTVWDLCYGYAYEVPTAQFGPSFDSRDAQTLLDSLAIRTSDLPAAEKGRRLAKLVKLDMTWQQVHAIFGETEALLYDRAFRRVVFSDYGVAIDASQWIICRDQHPESPYIQWDWLTSPEERPSKTEFNFLIGFTR